MEKQSPANGFTLNGLNTIEVAQVDDRVPLPAHRLLRRHRRLRGPRRRAVAAGYPGYAVAAGRRDGRNSLKSSVPGNLPGPGQGVADTTRVFVGKGMSQEDAVVLSGAHYIGGAHCFMFSDRLYNFSAGADIDPAMDRIYRAAPERLPAAGPRRRGRWWSSWRGTPCCSTASSRSRCRSSAWWTCSARGLGERGDPGGLPRGEQPRGAGVAHAAK